MRNALLTVALILASCLGGGQALSQATLLQAGPTTQNHILQYSSGWGMQPTVNYAGGSGGGQIGTNPSEIGITSFSSTGTYPVTSGGNASAGNVGEFISSTVLIGSQVNVPNATATDITSVSLTAGDWNCSGNVVFHPAGTTTTSASNAWISTTSATLPTAPNAGGDAAISGFTATAGQSQGILAIPAFRVNSASPVTAYLTTYSTFAVSTNAGYGFLGCRRVR
jgi:hypothetical protein